MYCQKVKVSQHRIPKTKPIKKTLIMRYNWECYMNVWFPSLIKYNTLKNFHWKKKFIERHVIFFVGFDNNNFVAIIFVSLEFIIFISHTCKEVLRYSIAQCTYVWYFHWFLLFTILFYSQKIHKYLAVRHPQSFYKRQQKCIIKYHE